MDNKKEFKIGDKVKIPNTKSVMGTIDTSIIIKRAKAKNQDYLYIVDIEKDIWVNDAEECYALCDNDITDCDDIDGDYFLYKDLEKYNE